MTTLLTLERRSLDDVVTVPPDAVFANDDYGATSSLGLRAGERRTVRELLSALLLQSANDAAVALAVDIAGSEQRFVELMDRRARRLGMRDTQFLLAERARRPRSLDRSRPARAHPSGLRHAGLRGDRRLEVPDDPEPARTTAQDPEPERLAVAVPGRDR